MAKYTVRNPFVLHLETIDSKGRKTRQAFNSGTEVELTDEQFSKHRHQVEKAALKDTPSDKGRGQKAGGK